MSLATFSRGRDLRRDQGALDSCLSSAVLAGHVPLSKQFTHPVLPLCLLSRSKIWVKGSEIVSMIHLKWDQPGPSIPHVIVWERHGCPFWDWGGAIPPREKEVRTPHNKLCIVGAQGTALVLILLLFSLLFLLPFLLSLPPLPSFSLPLPFPSFSVSLWSSLCYGPCSSSLS